MAVGDLVLPPGFGHAAVKVNQDGTGHVCVMTFGVRLAGTGLTGTQAMNLLAAIANATRTLWDNTIHIASMHVLIGNDGPPMAVDASSSIVGSRTFTSTLPPNVTWLLKRITAFAGKQYRGRLYIPFVPDAGADNAGRLSGTEFTTLSAVAAALNAIPGGTPDTGISSWVVLHRVPKTGTAPAPTNVTTYLPELTVATQRRRLER